MARDTADAPNMSQTLGEFERLVFSGDYHQAMNLLIRILEAFERGADAPSNGTDPEDAAPARIACTRLAAAITTLFAMDAAPLTPEIYDLLAFHNRHLTAIFRNSGFASPAHLYDVVRAARPQPTTEASVARVLSTYSAAAPAAVDWRTLLTEHCGVSSSAYLAQFTHRTPLSIEAERRRNALLSLAGLLDGHTLRKSQLPVLCQAWMFCSYLNAEYRHDLKLPLNRLIRKHLGNLGLTDTSKPTARANEDKPTLVVVTDILMGWHAMYKTYANFLKQLRVRFKVVLVAMQGRTDDAARKLFDDVIEIEDGPSAVMEIAARVQDITPEIVYYPSVGMSVTTILLCNIRLAPIQVASVGHPATTHSHAMDYIVMGHEYYSDSATFSERVLLLQSTGALFEPTLNATLPTPKLRSKPEYLRIAISSAAVKLTAEFLTLCQRLADDADRPVAFHFFPNETGLRHRDCQQQILQVVPGAIVHRRTSYNDYMALLNNCDIRLGTFPFGGANTTMDAFLLGVPTVVFEGPEPHSRTDKRFITLLNLPDWLIARDSKAFFQAALRLIENDMERVALSQQILDTDPSKVLFEREQNAYPTDFSDTIWWAYTHHDAVLKTDRRVWRWEDREAFDAG
jgi:hypothetical protein